MAFASPNKESTKLNQSLDRRRFTRFIPNDGTMAVCKHALGPVLDISMGGLSCRYMHDKSNVSPSNLFGIFLGSEDILIDKIKSRIVSDEIISQDDSFLKTCFHKLSIEFISLSSEQRQKLKDFLLTKTQGTS